MINACNRLRQASIAGVVTVSLLAACDDRSSDSVTQGERSPLNADYTIEGSRVHLTNGEADVEAAPGSTSRIVTRYFGNEIRVDLDGDGRTDTVLLLTQSTGGSGTFYYVVAALDRPEGIVGSHGLLLGDRIAPQSMAVGPSNHIVVNYAERAPGESFAVPPTVNTSLLLHFDAEGLEFGVVAQDFEQP